MAGSELVTDEMVEAAAIALHNDHQKHHSPWKTAWDASVPEWRAQCTRQARAALTAVAPLLAARERESAAKLVDDYAATIGSLSGGSVPSVIEVACATIAAAIRERSA